MHQISFNIDEIMWYFVDEVWLVLSFISGKFWYPVLKTGTGRGEEGGVGGERGRRKDETRSLRGEMRSWCVQRCMYPHRLVSVGVDVARLSPGPERVAWPSPFRTPPIPLPHSPPSRSSFSPYLLARWCPPSREHKIQPGILISLPLCRGPGSHRWFRPGLKHSRFGCKRDFTVHRGATRGFTHVQELVRSSRNFTTSRKFHPARTIFLTAVHKEQGNYRARIVHLISCTYTLDH